MATNLGNAYVQIVPSAKGISGAIQNELSGGGVTAAATNVGSNIGSLIKKAIAAAGIGAAIKSSISQGMELEQNLGGTEAVFGKFADAIQEKATTAYRSMGLSASDYMATANKMGSLFQGSGVEQQKALNMTAEAMQRASDVASVMGIDMQMAMDSIAGAAKGNFTMMDNLGVAMNATTLQAYALEKGVNFKWNTATNAEKAELAMQMFMERTSQYAGNFARESDETLSGSIGAMKASWENLLGYLSTGGDVTGAMTQLVGSAITFVQGNLIPALGNIAKGIPVALAAGIRQSISMLPGLIGTNVSSISDIGEVIIGGIKNGMQNASNFLDNATTIVNNLTQGISDNLPGVLSQGVAIVHGVIDGIVQGLPELVESGVTFVQSLIDGFSESFPQIMAAGNEILTTVRLGILDALPTLIDGAGTIIINLIDAFLSYLPTALKAGGDLLGSLIEGILAKLPTLIASALSLMAKLLATIIQHLPDILRAGVELVGKIAMGIINGIPKALTEMARLISELRKKFTNTDWRQLGNDLMTKLINAIINGIESAVRAIGRVVTAIWNKVTTTNWLELGENIVKGLAKGIIDNAKAVTNAITGMVEGAWDSVKSFFGIESPSRLMVYAGKMVDLGFAKGIVGNAKSISNAINAVMNDAYADFMTMPVMDVVTSASYGKHNFEPDDEETKGFTQNITINSPQALSASEVARQTRIATQRMVLAMSM